jgi:PEP-CTERM motif
VTIFQGFFTSDTVVRTFTTGGIIFQIDASIKGYFGSVGHPGEGALVFESIPVNINNVFCRNPGPQKGGAFCNTRIAGGFLEMVVTPEPSTLGLLGTGILGIAGAVRKKILAR